MDGDYVPWGAVWDGDIGEMMMYPDSPWGGLLQDILYGDRAPDVAVHSRPVRSGVRDGAAATGKVYAVARGRVVGLFRSWPEAEASVVGYSGAVHKAFNSVAEARAFMAAHSGPGRGQTARGVAGPRAQRASHRPSLSEVMGRLARQEAARSASQPPLQVVAGREGRRILRVRRDGAPSSQHLGLVPPDQVRRDGPRGLQSRSTPLRRAREDSVPRTTTINGRLCERLVEHEAPSRRHRREADQPSPFSGRTGAQRQHNDGNESDDSAYPKLRVYLRRI
jgi:hypothetical protein